MAFDVNQFHAEISKSGGVALASNFEVIAPSFVGKERRTFLTNAENLRFRIESISAPQRTMTTTDYRDWGAPYKIALQSNYIDVSMTIIMSPDMREREYFLRWQDLAAGSHRSDDTGFVTGYYDDYVSEGLVLQVFAEQVVFPVYELTFVDSYPLLVGELQNSWSTPEIQRMTVTMAFRYFRDTVRELPNQLSHSRTGLFSRLNQLGIGGLLGVGAGKLAGELGSGPAAAVFGASSVLSKF